MNQTSEAPTKTINLVVAGLGGQGVLKASDILSDAAWLSGADVKKSEIHGMAQRGGSVSSDVRFGEEVLSPMVPNGEADYMIVLQEDQLEPNRHRIGQHGTAILPDEVPEGLVPNPRSLNVAMLALLSLRIDIPLECWHEAIRRNLAEKLVDANLQLFDKVRETAK